MGILYLVSTPIGNIKDITVRALEVLESTHIIACEDTRHTGSYLSQLEQKGALNPTQHKLVSYYDDVEEKRTPEIISYLLHDQNVALVSDAGTPTISDPGFKLVRECIRQGIEVRTVPGASSVIAALSVSGLPTDKFLFLGYLPQKQGNRVKTLEGVKQSLESIKSTVVFFEAPHKIVKTLIDIQSVLGDIELTFARELTKMHEEVVKETVSQALVRFEKQEPRGEFVILFNIDL